MADPRPIRYVGHRGNNPRGKDRERTSAEKVNYLLVIDATSTEAVRRLRNLTPRSGRIPGSKKKNNHILLSYGREIGVDADL